MKKARQKKKEHILYDSIYINFRQCELMYSDRKQTIVTWGRGMTTEGWDGGITKGHKKLLGVWE